MTSMPPELPPAKMDRRSAIAGSAATAAVGLASLTLSGSTHAGEPLPEVDKPGRTPNTKFAVNIEMWFGGPMEERIEKAAELGFPAVEFWPYKDRNIAEMAKVLSDHEMTCSQFTAWGFGTELNHPEKRPENFIQSIKESCDVAQQLPGCDLFTVVLGNNIRGLTKEQMHAAAVEKIKQVVPILEEHKKTIIIEPMNPYNHPGHCLYGSADGIAICKAIGSQYVKLNWDLFHMQRYEGNLIDNLRKGHEYAGYLQLADSPARNEPGTGEINYTQLFKVIKEIGYTRPVGLECSPEGRDVVRAARRIYQADTW
ncbi:MAG: TIM barrel protein [Planctomycetales bacterium]|nr:TIM barrel protein [Planctomycetales bacterium]